MLKIGLLTRNPKAWCSSQLRMAMVKRKIEPVCFRFSDLVVRIACKPEVTIDGKIDALRELKAIIIRPIGLGSLDEIIFRLDLLHRLERLGLPIINSPSAIEKAVDKYYALALLEEAGVPVPRTIVIENVYHAMDAFYELGQDVIVKPLFGSRGVGITRVTDPEVARRIFQSLDFVHHVIYLQEFIPHGTKDIRAFVVGDRVIAAMYRVAHDWKTNVSLGAKPIFLKPSVEVEKLAVKAAKTVGCEIAGVDILEGANDYLVNEINSQPGFRGLQSVSKIDIAGEIVNYVLGKISSRGGRK